MSFDCCQLHALIATSYSNVPSNPGRSRLSRYKGRGGFDPVGAVRGFAAGGDRPVARAAPSILQRVHTRNTQHTNRSDARSYLSFEPTIGRNSRFLGLTSEQKEELGGVEYRVRNRSIMPVRRGLTSRSGPFDVALDRAPLLVPLACDPVHHARRVYEPIRISTNLRRVQQPFAALLCRIPYRVGLGQRRLLPRRHQHGPISEHVLLAIGNDCDKYVGACGSAKER